nr:hypothetical protein [Tanacetum cinerariifolium]
MLPTEYYSSLVGYNAKEATNDANISVYGPSDGEGDLDLLRDEDSKSDGGGEDDDVKSDGGDDNDGKVVISFSELDMMINGANIPARGVIAKKVVGRGVVISCNNLRLKIIKKRTKSEQNLTKSRANGKRGKAQQSQSPVTVKKAANGYTSSGKHTVNSTKEGSISCTGYKVKDKTKYIPRSVPHAVLVFEKSTSDNDSATIFDSIEVDNVIQVGNHIDFKMKECDVARILDDGDHKVDL